MSIVRLVLDLQHPSRNRISEKGEARIPVGLLKLVDYEPETPERGAFCYTET